MELVHDPGCPHVEPTRRLLTRVLQEAGVPAVWTEWSTGDPDCPAEHRSFGSPTVLVNGRDVAPGPHPWRADERAPRCRIYDDGDGGTSGVPPEARVVEAVARAVGPEAG